MCQKRKFDKLGAMIALSMCRRGSAGWKRRELRMYYCSRCNAWHLTSKPSKHQNNNFIK